MIHDPQSDKRRSRLVMFLVGLVGLTGSAAIYFACKSSQPQTANESIRPAVTTQTSAAAVAAPGASLAAPEGTDAEPRRFGITNVDVSDKPVSEASNSVPPIPELVDTTGDASSSAPKAKKHNYRSGRTRIASRYSNYDRLPPPNFHSPLPAGQVEMWSGTRKAVVSVDPGTKFED